MKHLVLIGAAGSGKGTQAARLLADKGYTHISTGDFLRNEISKDSELGKKVKSVMDSGALVSDELVIELIHANSNLDKNQYVFDGYPRNLVQAQTLDKEVLKGRPSLAVHFKIDMGKLVNRLTNRRTCKTCGAIYNLISQAPAKAGICDKCGGTNLVHRDDDKEEAIKKRLDIFQQNTQPVLEHYKAGGRLLEVNAEAPIDTVFHQINGQL